MRRDGDRAHIAEKYRIAVRVGLGDVCAGDVSAGARPVFHDDLLAEIVAQLFRDGAPGDVAAPARGEAHHDGNGPNGISALRERAAGGERGGRK